MGISEGNYSQGPYARMSSVCSVPSSEPLDMEDVDLSNLAKICHLVSVSLETVGHSGFRGSRLYIINAHLVCETCITTLSQMGAQHRKARSTVPMYTEEAADHNQDMMSYT